MTGPFPNTAKSPHPSRDWAALAATAAQNVNARFGHPLMRLPGTWIGSLAAGPNARPPSTVPWSEWHYWWQAHYLDAILDAGFLALSNGARPAARRWLRQGQALLRGILIRNFGRFPNHFYDDMAWLALAASRLNELSLRLNAKPVALARFATRVLTRQLHAAHDQVLGGGLYWSRKRDYKNTPVNGPAALHFARIGELRTAAAVTAWLRTELFDLDSGLYMDGVHPTATGRSVERNIYTYNQGPILAALLRLGGPGQLEQAAGLVTAIKAQLSTPGHGLRLEPGGDGSLFTGILCRYLAVAARDGRLCAQTRETASNLIVQTAEQLLNHEPDQLSAAIQRWSIFSAAAAL
ncbi:glycoside hydrolase family 76 protein [Arthrobacter psychrochitiniphilus]|uniref:glycoside hydrolase family 76 protein n=1 Tax=Arthrobacter psychrochitiniphilus TaxID=291045 RepID=UPI003F7C903A